MRVRDGHPLIQFSWHSAPPNRTGLFLFTLKNAYRALADPRGWTCGFISRVDVADFLVKQIDDDAFLHKTPVLTS
jgi:hypothetical protein